MKEIRVFFKNGGYTQFKAGTYNTFVRAEKVLVEFFDGNAVVGQFDFDGVAGWVEVETDKKDEGEKDGPNI